MSSSVSHPDPVMHDFGDNPEDERLRGLTCGSEIGIFTRSGPDWKHYRATIQGAD